MYIILYLLFVPRKFLFNSRPIITTFKSLCPSLPSTGEAILNKPNKNNTNSYCVFPS